MASAFNTDQHCCQHLAVTCTTHNHCVNIQLLNNWLQKMPLTNAERQRQWRERQTDASQIACYLSDDARAALTRLGKWYRLTQRQLLERLAHTAETEALQNLAPESPEWLHYFGRREEPR